MIHYTYTHRYTCTNTYTYTYKYTHTHPSRQTQLKQSSKQRCDVSSIMVIVVASLFFIWFHCFVVVSLFVYMFSLLMFLLLHLYTFFIWCAVKKHYVHLFFVYVSLCFLCYVFCHWFPWAVLFHGSLAKYVQLVVL